MAATAQSAIAVSRCMMDSRRRMSETRLPIAVGPPYLHAITAWRTVLGLSLKCFEG